MRDIDTELIESLPTALSLFAQRKNSPAMADDKELEKERDLENLMKDLENVKVQLEAKEIAYKEALLKLDHHQKTADEITTLLRKSDLQKEFYINESLEADIRVNELESAMEQMAHQLSESEKLKEQLSHVATDLVSTQGRLLNMGAELAILREAKAKSMSQAEAMESALNEEKLKKEELLRRVSEMSGTIMDLKKRALKIEREKADAVSEKEAELELAAKAVAKAQEQLDCTRKQLETMNDLENQLLKKSAYISSLQLELTQASELHISSEKSASDAISELNKLKQDMELQEKKNLDQANYISLLQTDFKQLRTELGHANAEAYRLDEYSEKMKSELETTKEKENDAQVEIALLKFELHKGKLKLAAAEAAEARVQSEKSALHNALQQMGSEAEETKRENQVPKEAMKLAGESKSSNLVELPQEIHSQTKVTQKNEEANSENRGAISRNENEEVLKKVGIKNRVHNSSHETDKELENMKKELELAMSKIGELRRRAEQAISRTEAAEKAKAALEDEMKKLMEHMEKKKVAFIAPHKESMPTDFSSIKDDIVGKNYQSLGKVLDMKF